MTFVGRAARCAVLGLIIALGATACANPSAPSVPVTFTTTDIRAGSGTAASSGSFVTVNYAGWLYDGTAADKKGKPFDASKPGLPFVFWLGAGQVIQGWENGVPGMRVGGLRRLIVPASMAYGRSGAGNSIPPNASLVFDIELLSVF
jgi:FKBP-type peptidyl-prolyl cis-trans isomerase FkpA